MSASLKTILRSDEAPRTPLSVACADMDIVVGSVLRYLPDRRIVGRGRWSNQPVIFKLFAPTARARREYLLECQRLDQLRERGIRVPSPLLARKTREGAVLALEWLEGDTASALLENASESGSTLALIDELFSFVLDMHARGCLQTDIHLNNFLRHNGHWYLLDAGACRVASSLGRRQRVRNLADLLAQFPPDCKPSLKKLLRDSDIGLRTMGLQLRKSRLRRYRHMLNKTSRDCTEFAQIERKDVKGMVRRECRSIVNHYAVRELNEVMMSGEPLKMGNSATVVALRDPEWVVKRYNSKSIMHTLKQRARGSRARKSWRAGHFLRFICVRTPRPVAFVEQRRRFCAGSAWLITERIAGEPLDQCRQSLDETIIAEISRLFRLMLEFRVSHGDMKASNFIVKDGMLWLIDLDAVKLHKTKWVARRSLNRDAMRLLRNWPEGTPARKAIEEAVAPVVYNKNSSIVS